MRLPLRRTVRSTVLIGGWLILAVLAVEGGLRAAGRRPDFLFQLDPIVSSTFIPGKKGWYSFDGGRQWIEINSFGYRDREWSAVKDTGVIRVAALGDSYTVALEVGLEHRLSNLLEVMLNDKGESRVRYEVLNFGVSGYGTAQELETFLHRVLPLKPDIVILFVSTGNDWYDNSVELDPEPNRLHYTLDSSGQLVRSAFSIRDNAVKRWLRNHSVAYLFARQRLKSLRAVHRMMMSAGFMQQATREQDIQSISQKLQGMQYLTEAPPEVENAWEVMEALIRQMARVATENGVRFGIVVAPTQVEVTNRWPENGAANGKLDIQKSLRRVDEICRRINVSCLQLADIFRTPGASAQECFLPRDGHWTSRGHSAAAGAVFEWMRRDLDA